MLKKTATIESFHLRSSLLTAFLLLCFCIIAARLFYLQVLHGKEAKLAADAQHSIYKKLFPSRGEIKLVDPITSTAVPIATNLKSFLVYAVPQDILDQNSTAEKLAAVLSLEKKDILEKISNQDKKYVPLKKALTEEEQQKIKDLKLPGIFFDSEDTRFYPEKNLLSQVVGFIGFKNQETRRTGLYGLERYFETDLAGKQGELVGQKSSGGSVIFGPKTTERPAVDGSDLILTIDKTLQFEAENILKEAVEKNHADSGSIIVASPKTGAILAMANFPDFDPNQYNKVKDVKDFLNSATMENYEPGSVFKALTMAAALNEGKVGPDTTYVDTGSVEIDGYKIQNSDHKAHGTQTMTQVLDESLNTGAIFAKDQIGDQLFYKYVQNFGFGKPTGIELPEAKGNLDSLKTSIKINFHTGSFGQGISVTPIQLIQSYIALANQGKMMKPYIVQTQVFQDGTVKNTEAKEVGQVISPNAANMVSAMLVSAVDNGHGKRAGVPGYYIAGKTGTAQVPKKNGKGYEEDKNIGSFLGYGPVEDPKFVMLVKIDHPRDVTYAETTAAPAWGKMAQFILNYYHVAPTRPVQGTK